MANDKEAWASFWADPGSSNSGCLPAGPHADGVQRHKWRAFAERLPKGARVLDLGSGNGIVLQWLRRSRPDLKLVGVDSSPTLPEAPAGITLKSGVEIEVLPFPAGSFNAAVSQFGLEYSDTAAAARELARVLRLGAAVQFVVHHRQSEIVRHNLLRREALLWAAAPDGYLMKARALAKARAMAPLPTPESFRQAPQEARRLYPRQGVAAEFVAAILQVLELGRQAPPNRTLQQLSSLESRAAHEIARITALDRAARDTAQIGLLVDQLGKAGFGIDVPQIVRDAGAPQPFAWLLTGSRDQ
ncbi:MAG TPA: class I SAM-dependent methyltransferase [Allosphingosinicella sp.]|nr:class I SAM-dependent methyltransferase [Allosphingosinicella sp.]